MTIDELLTQLMKIKEIYPDSGTWPILADFDDLDRDIPIKKIRIVGNQLIFEEY